jgi:hypothetical protein
MDLGLKKKKALELYFSQCHSLSLFAQNIDSSACRKRKDGVWV